MIRSFLTTVAVIALMMTIGCNKSTEKSATPQGDKTEVANTPANQDTTSTQESAAATSVPKVKYVPVKGKAGFTTESYKPTALISLPYDAFQAKSEGEMNFDDMITIKSVEFAVRNTSVTFRAKGEMKEDLSGKVTFLVFVTQDGVFTYNMQHSFKPKVQKDEARNVYSFEDFGEIGVPKPLAFGSVDGIMIGFRDGATNDFMDAKDTTIGFIDHYWLNPNKYESVGVFWPLEKGENHE